MPAANSPDAIAAALVSLLTGVGTLGTVINRSPDTPFDAPTPLLLIRPIQNVHSRQAGSVRVAGAKFDQGLLEMRYRDAPLSQQRIATGNPNMQQSAIEDAMWANRDAIVAAIDAHRSLFGTVTNVGEDQGLAEQYNPDGYEVSWDNGLWTGWDAHLPYLGPKQNMGFLP